MWTSNYQVTHDCWSYDIWVLSLACIKTCHSDIIFSISILWHRQTQGHFHILGKHKDQGTWYPKLLISFCFFFILIIVTFFCSHNDLVSHNLLTSFILNLHYFYYLSKFSHRCWFGGFSPCILYIDFVLLLIYDNALQILHDYNAEIVLPCSSSHLWVPSSSAPKQPCRNCIN